MITISWAKLNEVAGVMSKLSRDPKAVPVASYRAGRIFEKGKSEIKKIQDAQKIIWDKYQEKDEKGEPKFDEGGEPVLKDQCGPTCYKEIMDLMEKTVVEIKVNRFAYDDIKHLTGADLIAIEDLVDGLPEEP